jgi:hypothetical protein
MSAFYQVLLVRGTLIEELSGQSAFCTLSRDVLYRRSPILLCKKGYRLSVELVHIRVAGPRRALVTVLHEPAAVPGEAALLTEAALAVDWSRPEEDAAWSHLQPAT